jgi:hypothetical protein
VGARRCAAESHVQRTVRHVLRTLCTVQRDEWQLRSVCTRCDARHTRARKGPQSAHLGKILVLVYNKLPHTTLQAHYLPAAHVPRPELLLQLDDGPEAHRSRGRAGARARYYGKPEQRCTAVGNRLVHSLQSEQPRPRRCRRLRRASTPYPDRHQPVLGAVPGRCATPPPPQHTHTTTKTQTRKHTHTHTHTHTDNHTDQAKRTYLTHSS